MQENDVLPINAFHSYLDSTKISVEDVEEFFGGIDSSHRYTWMGALGAERLNGTTEVVIFLLDKENAGPYMPYQQAEIARYTAAQHYIKSNAAPLINIDVMRLDGNEYDMLKARMMLGNFIYNRPDAHTIFSVDLVDRVPLPK
jgi:hypothetical protein